MLTELTAQAIYNPDEAKERILKVADKVNYETERTAQALEVSYCTLLRVLKRLGIRQNVRELWIARRKELKAKGKGC